jgi:hypothetical protein
VIANVTSSLQGVLGVPTCSTRGLDEGTFLRYRVSASAAVSHLETGLHLRASFVGAIDELGVDTSKSDDLRDEDSAGAGFRQALAALRVGHHRYGRLLVGHVTPEFAFVSPSKNGVTVAPRLRATGTAFWFYGVEIPAIKTSVLAVVGGGAPEVVQVLARDLHVPGSNAAISLGPTYLREEAQTIGLLRVRGNLRGPIDARRRRRMAAGEGEDVIMGEGSEGFFVGPTGEVSVEARDARLRHARLRFDARRDHVMVSDDAGHVSFFRAGAYAETTVFRSRFFEESRPGSPRPTSVGLGAGALFDLEVRPFAFGLDLHAMVNRPELLSLLPSAANLPELRASLTLRLDL